MTGEAFRKIRTDLGLSQHELADALGWRYYEIVSRCETRGKRAVPPKRAAALLAYAQLQECPTCGNPI